MSKNSNSSRQASTAVNHRRVFTVLTSLVATLATTAGILLLLEGQPVTSAGPYLLNLSNLSQNLDTLIRPAVSRIRRWNYIIVYQSGDMSGNAAELSEGRNVGGLLRTRAAGEMTYGGQFHFVVDNARNGIGEPDGYVQQGLAWRRQLFTAPYYSWPYLTRNHNIAYANAIGVCVIGDVNRASYSASQVSSTISLIRALQHRLNIPNSCVKLQWEIRGPASPRELAFSRTFHRLLRR